MMMGRKELYPVIILLAAGLMMMGCHSARRAIKAPLKESGPEFLFQKMKESELKFEWINAKFECTAVLNKDKASFKGHLRIRRDSIIWVSITPALGIEVARVKITEDSVKMINRINSTFLSGNFSYLNELINAEFDYDMLQSFIIGNDFTYYENDKFKSGIDNHCYLLSTVGRRKLKKSRNEQAKPRLMTEDLWLDPEGFKILRHRINEFKLGRKVEANYSDFHALDDGQKQPYKMVFEAVAEKKLKITIDFLKFNLNEPQDFPFNIPEDYQRIQKK
ncbi:MAG: DUF4292 domain-containing protein [Bacteroidota bacterium]